MAAYTVVPGASGGYAVEVRSPGGQVELVDGFATEKAARDWMTERQGAGERARDGA